MRIKHIYPQYDRLPYNYAAIVSYISLKFQTRGYDSSQRSCQTTNSLQGSSSFPHFVDSSTEQQTIDTTGSFQSNRDLKTEKTSSNDSLSNCFNKAVVKQDCDSIMHQTKELKSTKKKRSVVYRCKKCRTVLASEDNILPHTNNMKYVMEKGNGFIVR